MKAIDSEAELTLTFNITSNTYWNVFLIRMFRWPNFSKNLLKWVWIHVHITNFQMLEKVHMCRLRNHAKELHKFSPFESEGGENLWSIEWVPYII